MIQYRDGFTHPGIHYSRSPPSFLFSFPLGFVGCPCAFSTSVESVVTVCCMVSSAFILYVAIMSIVA